MLNRNCPAHRRHFNLVGKADHLIYGSLIPISRQIGSLALLMPDRGNKAFVLRIRPARQKLIQHILLQQQFLVEIQRLPSLLILLFRLPGCNEGNLCKGFELFEPGIKIGKKRVCAKRDPIPGFLIQANRLPVIAGARNL